MLPGTLLRTLIPAMLLAAAPVAAQTRHDPIRMDVDASDIARGIVHARMTFTPAAGPLTLEYPKWIPGMHRPSGRIEDLTGIRVASGGRPVAWSRDTLDNYTFHLDVPRGGAPLEVSVDFVRAEASHAVGMLNWDEVVLYPAGTPVDRIEIAPRVTLPPGWKAASALDVAREGRGVIAYRDVDLMTLVDSPVLMGAHLKRFPLLDSLGVSEELDVACDGVDGLEIPRARLEGFRRLVREARALFGATHYRHYRFLAGLSDRIPREGLEHHESTDIRSKERLLVDGERFKASGDVFAHEMVHSWNGKYRRPRGLAFSDYQAGESTQLLWVYEGLTQYLGYVLNGRSGLATPEDARMEFGLDGASMRSQVGRRWRNLLDTAVGSGPLRESSRAWGAWRRRQDYYLEGALVWLEADATIRRLSGGARSLDDFCRAFFGGESGPPAVVPYSERDVVAALEAVQPYDWQRFFDQRLKALDPPTPERALEAAGWKLVYGDSASGLEKAEESAYEYRDLRASLGVRLGEHGELADVIPGMPAARAGLAPGMKLMGVNHRWYSFERLTRAIGDARDRSRPIELLVDDGDFYRTVSLHYRGGLRRPRLERIAGTPDYLSEILAPRARGRR